MVGSSTDKVTINGTSGITIRENNVDTIALANGTITIGDATKSHTTISNSDFDITIQDPQDDGLRKRFLVGDDGDDGVQIAIGGASGADVSYTSTDDVIRITPGIGVFIFDNANDISADRIENEIISKRREMENLIFNIKSNNASKESIKKAKNIINKNCFVR